MPSPASETALTPVAGSPRSGPRHVSPPVTGAAREQMRKDAARLYQPSPDSGDQPLSIRDIARRLQRSYGFVWNLLTEAGVRRRPAHGHKRSTP
jgi:hypothetical protein